MDSGRRNGHAALLASMEAAPSQARTVWSMRVLARGSWCTPQCDSVSGVRGEAVLNVRSRVRRGFVWTGCAVCAIGGLGYVLSCMGTTGHISGSSWAILFERGALEYSCVNSVPGQRRQFSARLVHPWIWCPSLWFYRDPTVPGDYYAGVTIPYWTLVVIGLPACYLSLPRRIRPGQCSKCGYDLKGVPEVEGNTKCPECGETIAIK